MQLDKGDLFVVPSWVPGRCRRTDRRGFDLFRFSDAPIMERLHFARMPHRGGTR